MLVWDVVIQKTIQAFSDLEFIIVLMIGVYFDSS